jgi:hypothetical protein
VPATETEPVDQFDEPVRSRRERSRTDAKKEPAPTDPIPSSNNGDADPFPADEPSAEAFKTNRPDLGTPSETDDGLSKDSIIPSRGPAPVPFPEDDIDNTPTDASGLNLDGKNSTSAVSPKERRALHGRFETPRFVRLKLRPNSQWIAPSAAKLAQN